MKLERLGDRLKESSAAKLPAQDREALLQDLRAKSGGFTVEQFEFVDYLFLEITDEQVDQVNYLLPDRVQIPRIQAKDGTVLTLGAILSDCAFEGDTYYNARDIILTLTTVRLTKEDIRYDDTTGDSEQGSDEDRRESRIND